MARQTNVQLVNMLTQRFEMFVVSTFFPKELRDSRLKVPTGTKWHEARLTQPPTAKYTHKSSENSNLECTTFLKTVKIVILTRSSKVRVIR